MTQRLRAVFVVVFCGATMWHATGCASLPSEMTRVVNDMSAMVVDQGVLQQFQSNIDSNVFDPGIESYVQISAGVHLTGVQGEVDLGASGDSTRLPSGVRDGLVEQLGQPISDQQRNAILDILGWNRREVAMEGPRDGGT